MARAAIAGSSVHSEDYCGWTYLRPESRRSCEDIGDVGEVLCRNVGNRGWRGREWKGSIIAGEIGYEGMLLCGGTVAVSMPLHFD